MTVTKKDFLLIRSFVSVNEVLNLLNETISLPSRRVLCGIKGVEWNEQQIPKESLIFELFTCEKFFKLIEDFTQLPKEQCTQVLTWTSIYSKGEYINSHTDRGGTLQGILCLKNPNKVLGGWLGLNLPSHQELIYLEPGDLILFQASKIEHFTTPLIETKGYPLPQRVVAVARFYYS